MSSTDELSADLDDDRDAGGSTVGSSAESGGRGGHNRGLRDRLGSRLGDLFSVRALLLALGLSAAGTMVAGIVPGLPDGIAALLGVFAGTFLLGVVATRRRYVESAVAGAGVAVVTTLLNYFAISLLSGFGLTLELLSGGAGLLAGLLGHYFGRDLRAGFTRDLD